MQIQVLSIQPQSNQETFTVAIQMGQAVEEFCLTAKDTLVGAQPAHLIQGDEHFENTFAHLEGLRGQISSDVVDLLLLRQGALSDKGFRVWNHRSATSPTNRCPRY